jgi:hypothetical protein
LFGDEYTPSRSSIGNLDLDVRFNRFATIASEPKRSFLPLTDVNPKG